MSQGIEILSPAGSWETLKAAVLSGADAVYFGASTFNARRNAQNFVDSDIEKVVAYCHGRGVKAHLTLNTLVFDNEMSDALKVAEIAAKASVDAIIIQDLGLASIIHKAAPSLSLHASTQLSVHNINGVKELAKLGFSRVVLSRELSMEEIKEIAKESPVELEVFVHGALCMSVSGQCYMSVFFGGCRSANRGLCAQPCRLPFSIENNKNVLSLKDLSLIDEISELSKIGVKSLKIEGRMKRPEYVAAATSLCKKTALGEKVTENEKNDLQSVFSRSGFTQGYYNGKIDKSMFGIRNKEDVTSTAAVLKKFRSLYSQDETQRVKVDFDFEIKKDSIKLTVTDCDKNSVTVFGDKPEKTINHGISEETAAEKISKTGSTPFFAGKINVSVEDGFTTPVSKINSLRRQALSELLDKRSALKPIDFNIENLQEDSFNSNFKKIEKYRFCFHNTSQIPDIMDIRGIEKNSVEIIFVPLFQCEDKKVSELIEDGFKVGVIIPRAVYGSANEVENQLIKAKNVGIADALCANIGALESARSVGFKIHGDFGLNITNKQSLKVYSALGAKSLLLSFETPLKDIENIAKSTTVSCGMTVYGYLPLMLVRNCPVRSFSGCKMKECSIKDRMGIEFPLICNHRKDGASEILNSRPLCLSDCREKFENVGTDFINLLFSIENKNQVKKVIEGFINRERPDCEFTRGLYFKSVD